MLRAAEILDAEKQALGRMMTEEMGKTLVSAVAEAEKCALGCRYYAEHAEAALADEAIATGAQKSYVRYQPLGVVLAVMPWNFPFWQVFRFIAPPSWPATPGCSSTRRTCPAARSPSKTCSVAPGSPRGSFRRSSSAPRRCRVSSTIRGSSQRR